jgi:DNA-binding response OmpR family regulator
VSVIEGKILRRLASPPGQVGKGEELVDTIWGLNGLIHDHELERHISTLRQRLSDDPSAPTIIVRASTGYVLTECRQ